jgi:two-component system, LytTR family, response regulator
MRAVVIDDEKLSREVICNYLDEYCKEIEVVAKATSVKTGYNVIRKFKPDLVFLDIEMADGKGFDLLTRFDKIDFRIIFVTAYSNYAIKAFRFSAIDYLLKPVKIDELIEAVNKAKLSQEAGINPQVLEVLYNNLRGGLQHNNTIIIPNLKGFEVIKVHDIIMCQADGYCTSFFVTGKRKVVSSKNLKNFDSLLEDQGFIRVHHSYLVNIDHIISFTRQGEIFLTEGNKALLGESYKNEFSRRMGRK